MTTLREALDAILGATAPTEPERVPLADAFGRHVALDVVAREDAPAFDQSAMDGYAVFAADIAGAADDAPVALELAGASRAGGAEPARLERGTALRIFTGAPVPPGADAVVLQEDATVNGPNVVLRSSVWPGKNVRRRGTDILRGVVLLPLGHRIGAGEIAVLASQRYDVATVHRRPLVAILSTGDELRDIGDPAEPATIVGSNAPMLAALVRDAGGIPWVLPSAPDEPEAIAGRLDEALAADVILTSGGVSVGEHDHVREAMDEVGFETIFWKVRLKPGRPVVFGRHGGTLMLGLPGNPVSAFVTFEAFGRPMLRRLLGSEDPYGPVLRVALSAAHRRSPGRPELARASLRWVSGRWHADIHPRQTSGAMSSLVGADALVFLPEGASDLAEGTEVDAMILDLPTTKAFQLGPT